MARSSHHFNLSGSEIDAFTIAYRRRDVPWLRRIRFGIEVLRQFAANLPGGNFFLRILSRSLRVCLAESRVQTGDRAELPVSANVIVVGMRIEYRYRQRCEFG